VLQDAGSAFEPPLLPPTAKAEISRARSVPWHDGQDGFVDSRTSDSKWLPHWRHSNS
jgi:hypothetical protein